jgi:hypothetical protein
MLIVMSILLALGVRAWQDGRDVRQLISRSMTSFQNEITLNRGRIDDLYRYHAGLLTVLAETDLHANPQSAEEIRNVLDSLQSTLLLSSAWETALATGALAEMDYEAVFVLSLTYSYQQRFQALYNTRLNDVQELTTDDSLPPPRLANTANRYMAELTTAEAELLDAYNQAMELFSGASNDPGLALAEKALLP